MASIPNAVAPSRVPGDAEQLEELEDGVAPGPASSRMVIAPPSLPASLAAPPSGTSQSVHAYVPVVDPPSGKWVPLTHVDATHVPGSSKLAPALLQLWPTSLTLAQLSCGNASARAVPLSEKRVTATAAKERTGDRKDFMKRRLSRMCAMQVTVIYAEF